MCRRRTSWLPSPPCSSIVRCLVTAALLFLVWNGPGECRTRRLTHFSAHVTAYSKRGTTAGGIPTQRGVVAADPAVLPLGTRIRIKGPGISGNYVVADTGRKIGGRRIDIYMPNRTRARIFGEKVVEVQVLAWGDGGRG